MATNGRKRYFHIDENASSEQIFALLDDVESADEDDIENLMNDSDAEFIAEEEIRICRIGNFHPLSPAFCLYHPQSPAFCLVETKLPRQIFSQEVKRKIGHRSI